MWHQITHKNNSSNNCKLLNRYSAAYIKQKVNGGACMTTSRYDVLSNKTCSGTNILLPECLLQINIDWQIQVYNTFCVYTTTKLFIKHKFRQLYQFCIWVTIHQQSPVRIHYYIVYDLMYSTYTMLYFLW